MHQNCAGVLHVKEKRKEDLEEGRIYWEAHWRPYYLSFCSGCDVKNSSEPVPFTSKEDFDGCMKCIIEVKEGFAPLIKISVLCAASMKEYQHLITSI